jgi:Ca2+-binding EF-hand superfamily protein
LLTFLFLLSKFDTLNTGTITLKEFSQVLSEFDYNEEDIMAIFRKVVSTLI